MALTYEFAYYTVYNRQCPNSIISNLPVIINKDYKDILADINIKSIWIDKLLTIKNISLLSLFSGRNRHFITHIIFSTNYKSNDICSNIVNEFISRKYKASYNNYEKSFFCLATRNWYRNEYESVKLFKWWDNISTVISEVINA
jgi:hypothetical protein